MPPFRRVFALVPDCHAYETRYARLWRRHFYEGLAGAVPEVIFPISVDFRWARPAWTAPLSSTAERTTVSERLWDQVRAAGVDAVISYCFASDIEVGLVQRAVEHGIPWINFFCDSVVAFDRVEPLARAVSLSWFPEGEANELYRALGRPQLCRPYAVNPAALPESICEMAAHRIGFVGAPFTNRVIALGALRLYGCKVNVHGEGWVRPPRRRRAMRSRAGPGDPLPSRHTHGRFAERLLARVVRPLVDAGGPLDAAQLPAFLSTCRLVLGLNAGRDPQGRYHSYLKCRDVEFPGYGSCYLTEHNEDVARAFEIGREVLTFHTLVEAAALVRETAADPARARAIGRAGRRRVMAEHTWSARLPELARAL